MADDREFQRRLETIERGIHELEGAADPDLRQMAQELVQAILELHGAGLERFLEIIHASGVAGGPIIDRLGRDPLVSGLLVLHSLHPLTLEARILQALERIRPILRADRADTELIGIADGRVRVRFVGGPQHKSIIEDAVVEAAPDLVSLEVAGTVDNFVGFVPLESLKRADARRDASQRAPVFVPAPGA
jgi:hypothetical protein